MNHNVILNYHTLIASYVTNANPFVQHNRIVKIRATN